VEPQYIEGYFEESKTAKADSLVSGPTIPGHASTPLRSHCLKIASICTNGNHIAWIKFFFPIHHIYLKIRRGTLLSLRPQFPASG
jgi:hypothetical protein